MCYHWDVTERNSIIHHTSIVASKCARFELIAYSVRGLLQQKVYKIRIFKSGEFGGHSWNGINSRVSFCNNSMCSMSISSFTRLCRDIIQVRWKNILQQIYSGNGVSNSTRIARDLLEIYRKTFWSLFFWTQCSFRQHITNGDILGHYWKRMRSREISPLESKYSTCATLRGHLSNSWALFLQDNNDQVRWTRCIILRYLLDLSCQ